MTTDTQDLLNLVAEIKQAKQQLIAAHEQHEHMMNQYKQAMDDRDQSNREYLGLMRVFEYCVEHDCDPAYAKLMLSDTQTSRATNTTPGYNQLKSVPSSTYARPESFVLSPNRVSGQRTFKQKMVDWMLKR